MIPIALKGKERVMELSRLRLLLPFEGRIIIAAALVCIPVVYICISAIARLHATHLHHAQEQQLRSLVTALKPTFDPTVIRSENAILERLESIIETNSALAEIQWKTPEGKNHVLHTVGEMQNHPGWLNAIAGISPITLTVPIEHNELTLRVNTTPLLNTNWQFFQSIMIFATIGVIIFLGVLYAILVKIYNPIRQTATALEHHIQYGAPWDVGMEGSHDWSRIIQAITRLVNKSIALRQEHTKALSDSLTATLRLNALFDALPFPIYIKDSNGIPQMQNRALMDFFKVKHPTPSLPIDAEAAVRDRETDIELNKSLEPVKYESILALDNGDKKTVKISKSPILTAEKKIDGIVVAIEDITFRTKMESELRNADYELANLRASNRAKNAFIANISHEMRTPLTAIIGFSETLLDHDQSMTDRIEGIKTIIGAGKHLHRIINEILDLEKMESGKLELESTNVQLFGLVDEVSALAKIQARSNGASFNVQYQFPLPVNIQCDPIRTKQILYNLIGNAIKFSRGGEIELSVSFERTKSLISFAIKDTGIGITPDQLSRLFTPFVQAETSTARHYGGTGLGLYLSRNLAQSMGGDITVTSELGKGSCFVAKIRINPENEKMLTYEPIAPIVDASNYAKTDMIQGSVLIVDDQPDNRRLVGIYLSKLGVECHFAENGEDAINVIEKTPFDLVLMDINMPIMDGITAIRRLRENGYTGTAFAFTADVARENIASCIDAGFNDIVPKPIDRPSLISKVSAHLKPALESPLQPSPLASTLSLSDPANLELIRFFADVLPIRLNELWNAYHLGNWNEIQDKATLLQDLGSGYGYPKITESSAKLKFCAAKGDKAATKSMLDRLKYLSDCIVLNTQETLRSSPEGAKSKGKLGGTK